MYDTIKYFRIRLDLNRIDESNKCSGALCHGSLVDICFNDVIYTIN